MADRGRLDHDPGAAARERGGAALEHMHVPALVPEDERGGDAAHRPADHDRALWQGQRPYQRTATGPGGAPAVPVNGSGGAETRNSYTPSAAQASASSSSLNISPMSSPMYTRVTMCTGWKLSGSSFGRTSKPQVSVAIAATSRSAIQGIVWKLKPGEGPPA